jgi:hypothetical protein
MVKLNPIQLSVVRHLESVGLSVTVRAIADELRYVDKNDLRWLENTLQSLVTLGWVETAGPQKYRLSKAARV